MAEPDIKRYRVPTHLKINDHLTIGFMTFTWRQLGVLAGGGWLANAIGTKFLLSPVAHLLEASVGDYGTQAVRWVLVGGIGLLTLALAFFRHQGRTFESWGKVWFGYVTQPRRYRWRQQPDPALVGAPPRLPVAEESEDA